MGLTLGVSPYVIKNHDELYLNLQATLQTLIVFIIQLGLLYVIQTNEFLENIQGLIITVSYVSTMCFRSFSVIFVIIEFFNKNEFCQIISDLQLVDDVIVKYQKLIPVKLNYNNIKKVTVLYVLFLLLELCATVYTYYDYILFVNYVKRSFFANVMLYYECLQIVLFICVKILVVNFILKQRFEVVNKILENNAESIQDVSIFNI